MIIDEPSVLVPQRVAVLLAEALRVTVSRERQVNGATIPAEVVALVDEWLALAAHARERATAAGCATPVASSGCAPPPSDLMTTAEAADLLDCSTSNVRARAGTGSLVGRKIEEPGWVFAQAAVEHYMATRQENN